MLCPFPLALFRLIVVVSSLSPLCLQASQLVGEVTDGNSNKPIPNALITIIGGEFATVTDHLGQYELVAVPGHYVVQVNAIGYEIKRQKVQLLADKTARANFLLNIQPIVQETMIVTATGSPKSVSTTTVPVEFIDQEIIRLSNAENVGALLENVLGLNVHSSLYGYLGSPTGVMIQGIDPNRVLILVDGEPVIGGPAGIIDLSKLPIANVERVEVVKGPHSALYGSDAMGGVVHIFTRSQQGSRDGNFRMRLGTGDLYFLRGEAGLRHDGLSARLVATRSTQDALDLSPDDPDTDIDEYSQRFLQGKLRLEASPSLALRASLRLLSQNELGISSQYFAPFQKTYTWRFPDQTKRNEASIGATWNLFEQGTIEFGAYRSDFKKNSIEELVGGRNRRDRFTDNTLWKGKLRGVLLTGGSHQITTGLEYVQEELEVVLERLKPLGEQTKSFEVPKSRVDGIDIYFQDDWKVRKSTSLVVGGRLQSHSRYGTNFTPKMSFARLLTSRVRLRGSYGKGYRAPSLKELHFIFDHSNLGYKVLGSPGLEPEHSRGINIGLEFEQKPNFSVKVNFFHNRLRNLIQTVFDPMQSTGSLAIYGYNNIGRATTYGVEVGLTNFRMDRFVVNGGYTYLRAREQAAQRDLPGRPRHALRFRIALSTIREGSLALRLRRDSPAWADFDAKFRSPGGQEIDLDLEQPLSRRLVLKCGIENVLNDRRSIEQPGDLRSIRGRAMRAELQLRILR